MCEAARGGAAAAAASATVAFHGPLSLISAWSELAEVAPLEARESMPATRWHGAHSAAPLETSIPFPETSVWCGTGAWVMGLNHHGPGHYFSLVV